MIIEENNKIDAKAFLLRVEKLDKLIANKMTEIEQWKLLAQSTTARLAEDKVLASGSQSKMADAVIKYVDLEKEIDSLIDELIDEKREVIAVIEQLDPVEYDLLHKKYIQYEHYKDFYDIAAAFKQTYSWATTTHGRALQQVRRILEERREQKAEKLKACDVV